VFQEGHVSVVQGWVIFFLVVSVLSLIVALSFTRVTPAMQPSAADIKESAKAFLKRQFKTVAALLALLLPTAAYAQTEHGGGGEANLTLPDLTTVQFFDMNGHALLMIGLLFCAGGLLFGLAIYVQLKNAPVHRTMLEVSDLIYETCKTYLVTQGKFILLLWAFIAVIISLYFGYLAPVQGHPIAVTLPIILAFSLIGIAGSYGVAWFGIRVNTFANSRTAFAGLRGKPYPLFAIPLKAGMSIGRPLLHRLRDWRIPGRRGPAYCRRHLHQDRRHWRRPHEDRIQDQGRRCAQPGCDRRLYRRQRGRLGRPQRRRLRNLRRHRRGLDHIHFAGSQGAHDASATAGMDLRHARGHAGLQLGCVLPEWRNRSREVRGVGRYGL
jgi:hypothetical protein